MRGLIVALIVALWTSSTLVHADPLADFRIPDHAWRSGAANFGAHGSWSANSWSPGQTNRSSTLGTGLGGSVTFARDSDPLQHELNLSVAGATNAYQDHSASHDALAESYSDRQSQMAREHWLMEGSLRTYPWQTPLGLEGGASAEGGYIQGWDGVDLSTQALPLPGNRAEERRHTDQHVYDYDLRVHAAAGFGRVRDATVVFDVYLLEQRLQEASALQRPLSDAAREKLAALFYVRPGYAYAHERPDRFFWRDVDEILRADSCLAAGGLDPFHLTRVQEGYQPVRGADFVRARGWFAGPLVQASHRHTIVRSESSREQRTMIPGQPTVVTNTEASSRLDVYEDQFMLGGRLGFHRPLGWRWQVDLESQILCPLRPDEHGFDAASSAQLIWLIADRWKGSAGVSHARTVFEPRDSDALESDDWNVDWSGVLSYYVEDRTELYAEVHQSQMHELNSPGDSTRYARDTTFDLGMRYRFMGALDAAGLITPQRLLH